MSRTETSQDDLGAIPGLVADPERIDEFRDRVVERLFGAGLTLASILGVGAVDPAVAQRLRDVMHELDEAVRDIRGADFAPALADPDARPEPAHHLAIVPSSSDGAARAASARAERRRWLCRFDTGQVFAYATPSGHDFFRAVDHTPWAHESSGLLLSARSGAPLARRVGQTFHDIDSEVALYYERAE